MTNQDKINLLKSTIEFLYTKEGRPKAYIARLLDVDRKLLTYTIKEWGFKQANSSYLSPANQKFVNKHRLLIKSRLDDNITQKAIAEELNVTPDYIRNIIHKDSVLAKANNDFCARKKYRAQEQLQSMQDKSSMIYDFDELPNERWSNILGYDGYLISDYGRVKHFVPTYGKYVLLTPYANSTNGRMYIKISGNNIQIARLVGFNFVRGNSDECNTIDHIDGNVANNHYTNLEWVSQGINNARAYSKGRNNAIAYAKHGKFKYILVDNKFEFKTIVAMAKFMNVSETQAHRYIDRECDCKHTIELVY